MVFDCFHQIILQVPVRTTDYLLATIHAIVRLVHTWASQPSARAQSARLCAFAEAKSETWSLVEMESRKFCDQNGMIFKEIEARCGVQVWAGIVMIVEGA
jgi:hypothetical protein